MPYGDSGYSYEVVPHGGLPGFPTSYDSSGFTSGTAPFSSGGGCGYAQATNWPPDTDLLAVHSVDVPAGASGVSVSVAIDNDIEVYWDGTPLGPLTQHDGCASNDNPVTYPVSQSLAQPGTHQVAVRAIDRGALTYFDATVRAAEAGLTITTGAALKATVNQPYQTSLAATGGTPPYTWSVSSPDGATNGGLPCQGAACGSANYLPTAAGGQPLSFDPTTGVISGVPAYAGSSTFKLTVTDSASPPATASETVSLTVDTPFVGFPQTWALCLAGYCPPEPHRFNSGYGSDPPGGVITNPHVAFLVVGKWWCTLFGTNQPPGCPRGYANPQTCPGCAAEASGILGALNSLALGDYSDSDAGGYDYPLANEYYKVTGCGLLGAGCNQTYVGSGLQIRHYAPHGGTLWAGPFDPGQVVDTPSNVGGRHVKSKLGATLNNVAGGFGIDGQSDVDDTVFVLLYAPNLLTCPSNNLNVNSQTGPGTATSYGSFVYAKIQLEDTSVAATHCAGDLNDHFPTSTTLSPEQWATFATSHELDEAITSPGGTPALESGGWIVQGQSQVADSCQVRNPVGGTNEGGSAYPYFNFTRDTRGSVVAAYIDPGGVPETNGECGPDVATAIPPG
jgi:hypothetical protein